MVDGCFMYAYNQSSSASSYMIYTNKLWLFVVVKFGLWLSNHGLYQYIMISFEYDDDLMTSGTETNYHSPFVPWIGLRFQV